MPRLILSFCLTALVLLSHVGIPVYTHVCRGQEKTWHSIAVRASTCCSGSETMQDCADPKPTTGQTTWQKQPCCEDHTAIAALDTDFTKSQSSFLLKSCPAYAVAWPAPAVGPWLPMVFSSRFTSFQPHAPPPRLWGRSLLIFKSVFRC
jgi:hypothetical protein